MNAKKSMFGFGFRGHRNRGNIGRRGMGINKMLKLEQIKKGEIPFNIGPCKRLAIKLAKKNNIKISEEDIINTPGRILLSKIFSKLNKNTNKDQENKKQ